MLTIQEANELTQEQVEAIIDLERARAVYRDYPNRPESQKLTRLDYQPEYEWMADILGDVFVLVEIRVDECEPSEKDWEVALQYETTKQYIEWYKQGHLPPPIKIVEHVDGHLVSCNRRRWLAAREAGVEVLQAWYSPTTPTGRPKWEMKACTFDRDHVCKVYARGGSCVDGCDYYEEVKN